MKNRALMFALAVFFVSSLAFADNPTDAPLKPNDDYAVLLHPERGDVQKQDVQKQAYQNQYAQTSHKRKRSKKNDASVSSKARSENSPKDNRQEEGNPGSPAANGKFAGSN